MVVGFSNPIPTFLNDLQVSAEAYDGDATLFVEEKLRGFPHKVYVEVMGDFWGDDLVLAVSLRKSEDYYDGSGDSISLKELDGLGAKLQELGLFLRDLGFNPGEPGIHCILNVS